MQDKETKFLSCSQMNQKANAKRPLAM